MPPPATASSRFSPWLLMAAGGLAAGLACVLTPRPARAFRARLLAAWASWRGLGPEASPAPRGRRALKKHDPEAFRAQQREHKRQRKAQKREEAFRAASQIAPTDAGVKRRARRLNETSDVMAHNAWDAVPWDEDLEREVAERVRAQAFASAEDVAAIRDASARSWDAFYALNLRAYKNRRYLRDEFPELGALAGGHAPVRVLEVGCGPGSAVFPLLAQFPSAHISACDISSTAVELLTKQQAFDAARCAAFVWDVAAADGLPPQLAPASIDVALLIFVLSALPPDCLHTALTNVYAALRPGGVVLFRDYGEYDAKQSKFAQKGTRLGERWYARQDGTMAYFFTTDTANALFAAAGFEALESAALFDELRAPPASESGTALAPAERPGAGADVGTALEGRVGAAYDKQLTVNRKSEIRIWRVWVTGRFCKPGNP